MANKLKENINELYYWNNSKIHLGDLKNYTESSVINTLIYFFIMPKSNEIIAINGSGFSLVISIFYIINYTGF